MANIYDSAIGNINQAGQTQDRIAQGGALAQSANAYVNPYQQQVVGQTLGRMQDQFGVNLQNIGDQAQSAGAFGGGRHGVVEATALDDFMRSGFEATNTMNQQGFNTAMGLGAQDVNQQLAGASGLAQTGASQYGIGNQITQNQMNSGNQQQQLAQSILDMGNSDFGGYMNNPSGSVQNILAALSGSPLQGNGTQTTSTKPGLFDYLGLGAQVGGKFASGGK